MNKKTVRDINVKGRRVLMRVDFNVPIDGGRVTDDTRITAALPTLRYVLDQGGSLVLMSHLGRPKGGKAEPEFSLRPVAERLQALLGRPVQFAADCRGEAALAQARALKPGDVLLLENTRFYKEEAGETKAAADATEEEKKAAKAEMKKKQEAMARDLAALGDVFVNDAFGSAHRAHASTAVVCKFFKESVAGFLMEKEIDYLSRALGNPQHPFVAVLGGAKVADKVAVIANLLTKVDSVVIGGAMAYTFYRAKGLPTGNSKIEGEKEVGLARTILAEAQTKGVKVLLPVDHVCGRAETIEAVDASIPVETVGERGIRSGWMALDVGPQSARIFADEVSRAKTVVWNGPLGLFEIKPFSAGTLAMARAVAAVKGLTIVGGGDSVTAVNETGLADRFSHVSTGGGACLEFLEGRELPGVAALTDR